MSDWVLSIDFGTTHTAAAFALPGQPPQAPGPAAGLGVARPDLADVGRASRGQPEFAHPESRHEPSLGKRPPAQPSVLAS